MAYRHEYLGEVTGTGGAVFENVSDLRMDDAMVNNFDRIYHGLDFGFALDPLAYVKMHYDKKREDLYIFDEFYEPKISNKKAFRILSPKVNGQRIIADSAEPKSISELRSCGMDIYGAVKGADSVDYGMKWLQDRAHIYIDKERCPNTYREFVTYEYLKDRNGKFISAYPDKNNHAIDATRYGMNDLIKVLYPANKYGATFNI
jgi:phage terminase large subunit